MFIRFSVVPRKYTVFWKVFFRKVNSVIPMLISQDQIVINFKWDSVVAIPLSGISSSTVSKPKLFEICCCQSSCCLQSSNIWPRKQFEGVFATKLLPGSCRCYACVLVEINDIPATLIDMESVLQKFP